MGMVKYDLAIVGGGPAGYTAALEAEKEGMKVALFEKEEMGGTCLNRGCIPMKSYLHCAQMYKHLQYERKEEMGFSVRSTKEFAQSTVEKLKKNLLYAIHKDLIDVKKEEVRNIRKSESYEIETELSSYEADELIIATGSEEIIPDIEGLDRAMEQGLAITSDAFFNRDEIPENVVIIGAGFVGMEIASFLKDINRNVTVMERMKEPFAMLDTDMAAFYVQQMKRQSVKFILGAEIKKIDLGNSRQIKYWCENAEKSISADLLIIAAGRRKNNKWENVPGNTYICGDASGNLMLAHAAMEEAKHAVHRIRKESSGIEYKNIPKVMYSSPEVAWIGKREKECNEEIDVIKIDMNYSSRFVIQSQGMRGILKILADKSSGAILGCQIVGDGASELISVFSVLISNQLGLKQISHAVFPHPSVAEVLGNIKW